ncbi:hypothetical protein SAMN05519103_08587 [Rhizobiales bacterium GAS113]|nr:hypothetical protein SAMN05519103_08587 [Rhizobiales bacterium GAS113]
MPQTFSKSAVQGFIEKLKALSKKERALTKSEAIAKMRPQLLEAQTNGYTLEELAELLKDMGIAVHRDTLRSTLKQRARNGSRVRSARGPAVGRSLQEGRQSGDGIRADRDASDRSGGLARDTSADAAGAKRTPSEAGSRKAS